MKKKYYYFVLALWCAQVLDTGQHKTTSHKKTVEAQGFLSMLQDMAIMLLPQLAATQSLQWVDAQDGTLYDVLSAASTNLQTDFSTFQNNISTFEQNTLNSIISSFSSAQTAITNESAQAESDVSAEISYLSNMVSLDLPKSNYLFSASQYDAYFEQSAMFTPAGATWRNLWAKGDWEFDPATKSFWQYNLAAASQSGSDAATKNNFIFTEFFTNSSSYNINCDVTLYSVSYPFYAGIMFNKTRWISGDVQGSMRYRTVGIYGASPTDISVYFAEQYYDSADVNFFNNALSTVYEPMVQIFSGTAQKLGALDASDFATLSTEEITLSFDITTSANTITVAFGKKDGASTSTSITSQSPTAFIYHGLGFISPGAVAQYTINEPTALIFADSAIEDFQKEVNDLIAAG
jgi:hypothetical protein